MALLDLSDIQGNILRGYGAPVVRIFVLRVDAADAARAFLGSLVSGDASAGPQITTAAKWDVKPPFMVNLGVTAPGFAALGVPASSIGAFPPEFTASPAARAPLLGDVGESAPETWIQGLACSVGQPSSAHLLLIVHAQKASALDEITPILRERFAQGGACTELTHIDGADTPDSRVHFGFRDGIAEPRIAGSGAGDPEDDQPLTPTGEFILGHPGINNAVYPLPQPEALGNNGSYLALRILKQDVVGFEEFLEANAGLVQAKPGVDPKELLAAKACGRWRNGLPLELSPDTDSPNPPIPESEWNKFDYLDDLGGLRCPVGSHVRRNNPRGGTVAGGGGHNHRLVRRGIPYGPHYDPTKPYDGIERGLVGLFFCGDLGNQFEFLMTEWINGDSFGLRGDLDPLAGNNDPAVSRLVIPTSIAPRQSVQVTGFGRFISTRGSVYCFMPSVTAIKHLSAL